MLDPSCTSSLASRLLQPTQSLPSAPTVGGPQRSPPEWQETRQFISREGVHRKSQRAGAEGNWKSKKLKEPNFDHTRLKKSSSEY